MRQLKLRLLIVFVFSSILLGSGHILKTKFKNLFALPTLVGSISAPSSYDPAVLGVQFPDEILTINVPTEFTQDVTINGKLALAGLIGGAGISINMSGTEPQILNTGILTINKKTGNLEITGSSGISINSTDAGLQFDLNQITTSKIADSAVTFSKLDHADCTANQVLEYSGSEWQCSDLPTTSTTTTVTGDNGLTTTGSLIQLGGSLIKDTAISLGTSFVSFFNPGGLGLKVDSTGLTTATGAMTIDGTFNSLGDSNLAALTTSGGVTINNTLEVSSSATISGSLSFAGPLLAGGLAGDTGYALVSQGAGLTPIWSDLSSNGSLGAWNLNGNNLTPDSTNYNVGIGTSTPQAKLDVSGDIKLSRLDSTTIGTAVQQAWTLNSNNFNYRRTFTVTNGDGANTLPSSYEITVNITGADAAKIYADSRSDQADFRVAYNSTEIARIVNTFTASNINFKFQLQSTIAPSGSSASYHLYYSNPLIASIPAQYSNYVGDTQLDSLDSIASWISSDPVQMPIYSEASIIHESTGSLKGIATVDNIGSFTTTSQGQLPAAVTNFGFAPFTLASTRYIYEVGGSSDGTAANAQNSIRYTSLNAATGNIGSFTTSGNTLPVATLDNSIALATPPIDSGTGVDGTLDLSLGAAAGGCLGLGLTWTSGTSTCTMVNNLTVEANTTFDLAAGGNGSQSFTIPSGPQAGKILTLVGGYTAYMSRIYDPTTNSYSAGPGITQAPSSDSHNFNIPSGPQAGKILVVTAGSTAVTKIYDPTTNTFGNGPALGANAGTGTHSFVIPSGSEAGKILTVLGGNTAITKIYDPATNTYGAGPALGANANNQAHSFVIPSGSEAGKILTVTAGAANPSTTRIYDPATNTYGAGPDLGANTLYASLSFPITSGLNNGKILTVVGNGLTTTRIYDPATNTYGAGPAIGTLVQTGSLAFTISSGAQAGNTLVAVGSVATTYLYKPSTNTFVAGPDSTMGMLFSAAHTINITSGIQTGKIMVISAQNSASTKTEFYDPATNTFGVGSNPGENMDTGVRTFAITSGPQAGNTLVIEGGGSPNTMIYRPATRTFAQGPSIGIRVSNYSYSFTIPSGSNAGKFLISASTGTATSMYDPATNAFSAGPTGVASYPGSHAIQIPSGSNAGKMLIIPAAYTSTTKIFDPATNTFGVGPDLGANAATGTNSFLITSGLQSGKILTIPAYTAGVTRVYDPATNTYGAGPALGVTANAGSHFFTIPSGSEAGKVLVFTGGGAQTSRIYDPATNTFSAGPAVGAGIAEGAHSFAINSGSSAGKILTVAGNSATTRIYDPATNTFSAGPTLTGSISTGATSFTINSGLESGKVMTLIGLGGVTASISNTFNPGRLTFNFSSISIGSGKTLTCDRVLTTSNFITLKSTGNVSVAGSINLSGLGYSSAIAANSTGGGPGYGSAGVLSSKAGGGGSYGGAGGTGGNGLGGGVYTTDDSGSSGGQGSDATYSWGYGGGGIKISSGGTITVAGSIAVTGNAGYGASAYGGGGGSGGRIYLQGSAITASGTLQANGGAGGNGATAGGGGGGGGRITLESTTTPNTTGSTITVTAGAKGTGGVMATAGSIGATSSSQLSSLLYVLGGKNSSGQATSNIYQGTISSSDGSMSSMTTSGVSLPQNLFGHSTNSLSLNFINYLYVLGGNNGSSDQTTVYKGVLSGSDISSFTTTAQAQLPTSLSYHSVATVSISGTNYMYIVGGKSGGAPQTSIYKATINSTTGNIDTLTSAGQEVLPQGLYSVGTFAATIGSNNYLYIIGGNNGSSNQTTVYKATIDGSGNVVPGSITTLGQTQLDAGNSGFGAFNFTDGSSNQYAYMLGGTTSSPISSVTKTLYSPINQTAYNLSRTFASSDLSNKGAITFDVYSSRTGSYAAFEVYNGTTWQGCSDNVNFSSGVFTVNSANTWETKTCDISSVTSKSTISGLRFRVTNSSSSPWTAYFDNITARLTAYNGVAASSSDSGSTLGVADLLVNSQGTGMIKLNYDPTNQLAGTGGLALYNGGSTPLFVVTPTGKVGIGTDTPTQSLDIIGNVKITGSYYVNNTALTVPDYVFAPSYGLMTLTDLQAYTVANGHLPDFPDESDTAGWGALSLENRDLKLLKTVEDVMLYLFNHEARLKQLETGGVATSSAQLTSNNSGTITIAAGSTDSQVTFSTPFSTTPFILISPVDSTSRYILSNVTPTGFNLQTDFNDTKDKLFNWMAILPNAL